METTRAILDHAINMPPAEKFVIIEGLLNSLDEPNKTIDEIWAIEAEKRLKAYKEGNLKTLTYEEDALRHVPNYIQVQKLMNSLKHGKPILTGNVTNISNIGFWILVNDKEYFVPFSNYPEFKNAKIDEIFNVQFLSPRQLYWQSLDCDIELDALEAPERFPLRFHRQVV